VEHNIGSLIVLDAIQAENHYLREFPGDKYPA